MIDEEIINIFEGCSTKNYTNNTIIICGENPDRIINQGLFDEFHYTSCTEASTKVAILSFYPVEKETSETFIQVNDLESLLSYSNIDFTLYENCFFKHQELLVQIMKQMNNESKYFDPFEHCMIHVDSSIVEVFKNAIINNKLDELNDFDIEELLEIRKSLFLDYIMNAFRKNNKFFLNISKQVDCSYTIYSKKNNDLTLKSLDEDIQVSEFEKHLIIGNNLDDVSHLSSVKNCNSKIMKFNLNI